MPIRPPRAAVTAIVVAALGAAGCGSEEETIPRDDADALLATLDEVQAKVEAGECSSAQTDASQFVAQVNALPKETGAETKRILREAGENLVALTQDPEKCEEPAAPESGTTGAFGFEGDG